MKRIFFFLFAMCALAGLLCSCVHKNMVSENYMTNDEVIKEVERLSELYLVDAKLNMDYLNRHPLLNADAGKLEDLFCLATPVYGKKYHEDSLGVFTARAIDTEEKRYRIDKMLDSLRETRIYSHTIIQEVEPLDERHELNYMLSLGDMDKAEMKLLRGTAFVLDKQTLEKEKLEMKDLSFKTLNNPPLVMALAFSVEYEGHIIVVIKILV